MVTARDIKADLPDWPDEVIEEWLLRLANRPDTGWPPPDDVSQHAWGPILGWRPLAWWKNVTWKLEDHDVGFDALCAGTKQLTARIADDIEKGNAADNSEARFAEALNHLAKTGAFQKPLVVMKLDDGLSVIDGNHRITALVACQAQAETLKKNGRKVPSATQKIWMGTHADGEVPLDYPES